jgi:hypothetical protein
MMTILIRQQWMRTKVLMNNLKAHFLFFACHQSLSEALNDIPNVQHKGKVGNIVDDVCSMRRFIVERSRTREILRDGRKTTRLLVTFHTQWPPQAVGPMWAIGSIIVCSMSATCVFWCTWRITLIEEPSRPRLPVSLSVSRLCLSPPVAVLDSLPLMFRTHSRPC